MPGTAHRSARLRAGRLSSRLSRLGPDGNTAAAEDDSGYVTCLDLTQGRILSVFRADPLANTGDQSPHVSFIPGGGQVVTATLLPDGRQNIQLWNPLTGERMRALTGGGGQVSWVAVHPVSGELLVAGPPASRAWSITGLPAQWTIKMSQSTRLPVVAFWNSDDMLFAPSSHSDLTLNQLRDGVWTPVWGQGLKYCRVNVSADGQLAAFADTEPGGKKTELRSLRGPGAHPRELATILQKFGSSNLRLSPNGDRIVDIENYNHSLEFFDTASGTQPVTLDRTDIRRVWDAGWLGSQRIVGITTVNAERGQPGSGERIVVWDAASGKIVQTAANTSESDVLAVAPDSTRFAEAGADKIVRVRDASLAVLREFRAHDGPITALAWHPSKPIIATASADLSIKIWNVDTGKRLEEIRGILSAPMPPAGLAFSPSGHRLACTTPRDATRIWEPPSLSDQPGGK